MRSCDHQALGRVRGGPLALFILATAWLPAGCAANVVIQRSPGAQTGVLGPLQRCTQPTAPCINDPSNDTSRFNAANTTFVNMPACNFGINRLLIQDSGSSHPVVIAECAGPPQSPASSGGSLPIMQSGGAAPGP